MSLEIFLAKNLQCGPLELSKVCQSRANLIEDLIHGPDLPLRISQH